MPSPRYLSAASLKKIDLLLFPVVFLLIELCLWMIFMLVPSEREMGAVQRIFYFHVGSAFACYCSVAIILVCSLCYLGKSSPVFEAVSEAASEVGFMFCTIVMITGMIWGSVIWNTPFNWEPRLVSFLLLWFIFLALIALRMFGDPQKKARHAAVLGIVAAVTVPIVVFSIQMLPQIAQLHPRIVSRGGLREPLFRYVFYLSALSLILLQFYLVFLRARVGMLEYKRLARRGR